MPVSCTTLLPIVLLIIVPFFWLFLAPRKYYTKVIGIETITLGYIQNSNLQNFNTKTKKISKVKTNYMKDNYHYQTNQHRQLKVNL